MICSNNLSRLRRLRLRRSLHSNRISSSSQVALPLGRFIVFIATGNFYSLVASPLALSPELLFGRPVVKPFLKRRRCSFDVLRPIKSNMKR